MTDINETLKSFYEEALDMGMTEDDAKEWAWDKLYGWREQMRATERIAVQDGELATLRKNVKDLQEQLSNANKRIAELVANNKNKQEALLDVVKILNEGLNKHGEKT